LDCAVGRPRKEGRKEGRKVKEGSKEAGRKEGKKERRKEEREEDQGRKVPCSNSRFQWQFPEIHQWQ
jgi:hypothetical protein